MPCDVGASLAPDGHPRRTAPAGGGRAAHSVCRAPAQVTYGGPTLGEHTFEILTETLAYDSDRIAELAIAELLE